MNAANSRRLYNIAVAVLLAKVAGSWLKDLWVGQRAPLSFDDAYMFARYAANMRHGLGVSWNLDGVHTYGPTSLLWTAIVFVLSYLPLGVWKMLTIASWSCSIAAVVALAWAVARNARSDFFSRTWRVLPFVVLPLADSLVFSANQVTGMETMLATLLAAVFVGLALAWRGGEERPETVAIAGFVLFLARPEMAIAVVVLPLLLYFVLPGGALAKRSLVTLLGVFAGGVTLDLLACRLYFHTAVPLSFYMKSRHGYEGYAQIWHADLLMLAFLGACQLYIVALVFLGRAKDWRLIVCCIAPALAVFAYLETVTQIMGFNARYYAPLFAFFIVPALLVLDGWFANGDASLEQRWPRKTLVVRSCVAAAVLLCFLSLSSEGVQGAVRRMGAGSHFEYDPVHLDVAANAPLPKVDWQGMMTDVADLLVGPLPAGTTVAATEVGYLGVRAPQVNIIDLAGLNDTGIALHGFDMTALLARRPDIIWMPDISYTYQRGVMLSDPRLLQQYDLYAGAANYGLAVRKDSPVRAQIDRQLQVFWSAAYPGTTMADYQVRSASWTGRKFAVKND